MINICTDIPYSSVYLFVLFYLIKCNYVIFPHSQVNNTHFKTNVYHLHQILIVITKRHYSPLIQFPPSSQISVYQRSCTTTSSFTYNKIKPLPRKANQYSVVSSDSYCKISFDAWLHVLTQDHLTLCIVPCWHTAYLVTYSLYQARHAGYVYHYLYF